MSYFFFAITNDFPRSLIIRIYRPIGLLKAKFQCVVHAQRQKYTSAVFTFEVSIRFIQV